MFRIKICGVTSPEDARVAGDAGADAIGLNFYSGSPRCITAETAEAIVAALPATVARVGVFVNTPLREMAALADRLRLDWLQLHGDEPAEVIAELGPRRVLKALRAPQGDTSEAAAYLRRCQSTGRLPDAVLIDAAVPGAYGGTGAAADWRSLMPPRPWLLDLPLVLAGGLKFDNVAAAIAQVRPAAVDTASGVESAPGRKDPERVRQFITAARRALDL